MNIDNLDTSRLMANPASPAAVARLQELRMEAAGKGVAIRRDEPAHVKLNGDRRFGVSPRWYYSPPRFEPWLTYLDETGKLRRRYRARLHFTRRFEAAHALNKPSADGLQVVMNIEQGVLSIKDYSSAAAGIVAYATRSLEIPLTAWILSLMTLGTFMMTEVFTRDVFGALAWLYMFCLTHSYLRQQRFHHRRQVETTTNEEFFRHQDLVLVHPEMKAAWNTAYSVLATGRSLSLSADVCWDKAWSNAEDFRAMRCVIELYEPLDRMSDTETIQDVQATIQDELTVIIEEVLRRHAAEIAEINDEVKNMLLSRRTVREVYGLPQAQLPDPLDELDSYPDPGEENPEQQ